MSKTCVLVVCLAAVATMTAGQNTILNKSSQAAEGTKYWTSDGGKWMEDPAAHGTSSLLVSGNPAKGGPSIMYVKFVPEAAMGWHWHPGAETYYGESGRLEVHILGSTRILAIGKGTYAMVPANVVHRGTCVSKEPCFFYLNEASSVKNMVDEHGNSIRMGVTH